MSSHMTEVFPWNMLPHMYLKNQTPALIVEKRTEGQIPKLWGWHKQLGLVFLFRQLNGSESSLGAPSRVSKPVGQNDSIPHLTFKHEDTVLARGENSLPRQRCHG